MKKRLVSQLMLGFSLVALPFLGGCTQQKAGSNLFLSSANAEPVTTENDAAAITNVTTNTPAVTAEALVDLPTETNAPVQAEAAMPETIPVAEQKPPANVHLSPVLSEAVKLIQSGVDQAVLLTFITNTTGYFGLGADEIVYLNDLGVDGNVLTIMMQHDQALRELRMNAFQAVQPATPVQVKEEEPAVASAPSYVDAPAMEAEPVYVSDNYFYDTLSPYGSWVYVAGYGRCWRPTVAVSNPGWRPYGDRGRWIYSDYGWYWLSDYTWGATTFHYGRWFNDGRLGWCWWPDTVWAPSWVSWRYTSDYCGWAPLPPTACYQSGFGLMYQNGSVGVSFGFGLSYSSYAFVPWGNFCGPRPYQYCAPASRAVHLYNNSTAVTRLEAGGRGAVYNRGIAPERVREYSRSEVRTVSVREQNGRATRPERLDRDGRTLAVQRPQFTTTATAGNANFSESAGRSGGRTDSTRARETVVSTPSQQTVSVPAPTAGRPEIRSGRERGNAGRNVDQTAPLTPVNPPIVDTKPPVTTPGRIETRPSRDNEQRVDTEGGNRIRTTPPVAGRPVPPTVTPLAPKVSQPNVVQPTARPTVPAQNNSIVVIGGRNNTRSSGRDYSVWSTPATGTSPNSPATRTTPSPVVNPPQVVDNSPAPVTRTQTERSRPAGNNFGRPENRSSVSTYSPPAAQVIPPTTRSTPSPSFNSRPVQSNPSPSVSPRPQPSAPPTAARVESRPAPAQPTTVPATTRSSPSPNQGRPAR